MWLTAVDYPFLWASWMLVGIKKGGSDPALLSLRIGPLGLFYVPGV